MAIKIRTIPPNSLEYEPILLPTILPKVRPRYVNIKLVIENIIEDNK